VVARGLWSLRMVHRQYSRNLVVARGIRFLWMVYRHYSRVHVVAAAPGGITASPEILAEFEDLVEIF